MDTDESITDFLGETARLVRKGQSGDRDATASLVRLYERTVKARAKAKHKLLKTICRTSELFESTIKKKRSNEQEVVARQGEFVLSLDDMSQAGYLYLIEKMPHFDASSPGLVSYISQGITNSIFSMFRAYLDRHGYEKQIVVSRYGYEVVEYLELLVPLALIPELDAPESEFTYINPSKVAILKDEQDNNMPKHDENYANKPSAATTSVLKVDEGAEVAAIQRAAADAEKQRNRLAVAKSRAKQRGVDQSSTAPIAGIGPLVVTVVGKKVDTLKYGSFHETPTEPTRRHARQPREVGARPPT